MSKLVLANCDYSRHMTNEGEQLQRGLEAAGWILAGAGYGDNCRDVPTLMDRYKPLVVFVQDRRDWDPHSPGAFRKDIGFTNLRHLIERDDIFKVAPLKDAATMVGYQCDFFEDIHADAVVHYYAKESVLRSSGWAASYRMIRTWHTVDAADLEQIDLRQERAGAVVSGACDGRVYPLRFFVFEHARALGVQSMPHPGYGNEGTCTNRYLRRLAGYKVHIATASKFHFALRKIIESVAVGCIPITNLPVSDVLPFIDGALVRIPDQIPVDELRCVIAKAEDSWDLEERMHYAALAAKHYDYREMGRRLDEEICLKLLGRTWSAPALTLPS